MDQKWKEIFNIIKENVDEHNFDTWIKPLKIMSMDEQTVRFSVPNRFFRDWLEENHLRVIADSFRAATGRTYQIDFVITQEKKAPEKASPAALPDREVRTARKSSAARQSTTLNPKYSFARFVIGASNQFAHAAAMAVAEQAEQTTKSYNPLFIYGGVGLGKTHLLNAIGLKVLDLHPHMNVVYVSAESFMNELINCIRFDKMPGFRDKYRNIDCLLMDDIQFIAGKERTQEEFFHTFNTLHDAGKQIVVTSDKFPKEIPNLESRIRNRFEWGLIADIQPPDIETKVAIVEKKANENNIDLPANVSYYIATNAESNIRELEGFLLRIVAYSSLKHREIDIDLVRDVLKHMIRTNSRQELSIDDIIKVVGSKYGVKAADVKSHKKNKNIVAARQMCMYLARKFTNASFPDIGERIGGRDHSTVIYACKKLTGMMENDRKLKNLCEELEEALNNIS
ncbi:MAG TPA: chromosomal replication initiator protein DnaA [Syntrophales bacterium]|nr:chromosomal replication initiator protein DnaA [Syntrophales bacterium]HOU76934.1 chromosomal replication initiator protein DnaA [Syntrophales bacterium]HPC31703.1 chromosomal replication initiator protein DnaA [Syntrophales bacterium]HQG34598.1 chromosomal replication initiator protein DnaA [Syntrophales bacterium]HQI36011.1 chromosomal replication initiator protein DnaA [Syntrophales bacterium]